MDTTGPVVQAQHGDEGAFASLAVVGNRLHAIAHRILRDFAPVEEGEISLLARPAS